MAHATKDAPETAAEHAELLGWDLYQLDGYWYVNNAKGARRQPGRHDLAPENGPELGNGSDPKEAMKGAMTEQAARTKQQKADDRAGAKAEAAAERAAEK